MRPRELRGGRGVTLIEVVVALLLLAVGALSLAGGIAASERARHRALAEALALAAAEAWLEAWRAAPWDSAGGAGADSLRWGGWTGVRVWTAGPLGPCRSEARVETRVGARRVTLVTRRFREGAACGE